MYSPGFSLDRSMRSDRQPGCLIMIGAHFSFQLRSAWLPMPAGTVVTIIRTIDIGAPLDPKLTSPDELWSRRQGSLGLYLFWLLSWRHFHNCKAAFTNYYRRGGLCANCG